jgi:hypothetical protein
MSHSEQVFLRSEIATLQSLLAGLPTGKAIARLGFEARLKNATEKLTAMGLEAPALKAQLTFRGRPVWGVRGIAADFAAQATTAFTDAVAAMSSSANDTLSYMGRIPDRANSQIWITGVAVGSFGFEFELPSDASGQNQAAQAIETIQSVFQSARDSADDGLTQEIQPIHPRALKKVSDFLDYLAKQEATCGLSFKETDFKFTSLEQLIKSSERLKSDNIINQIEVFEGQFQGFLPESRTFEFKTNAPATHLKGDISIDIADTSGLNRDWLNKTAKVKLHKTQVGKGRPRYALLTLQDVQAI